MKSQFDLDPRLIYLNSGTFSLTPRSVLDAMVQHQRNFEQNPTRKLVQAWGELWQVQKQVAAFFQADPTSLFFRSSVTRALNDFILGIPLPKDSTIVVSDLEYGAIVNLCRWRCKRDGLKLHTLHLPVSSDSPELQSPEALSASIISQLPPDTSLLMLSHVLTGSGTVLPIEQLGKVTRSRQILLVIDGAHGPGAVPLDFSAFQEIDFYGGNLHKWMMGPKGTAFGWAHPRHHSTLEPIFAGWTTFETPPFFARFGEGSRFAARMLHSACQNFAPFFALTALLDFWRETGPVEIQERIHALDRHLETLMQTELGWAPFRAPHSALQGPLLAYPMPGLKAEDAAALMESLTVQHGLQVAIPGILGKPCLRLSPHIYNTEEDINRAVEILKKTVRRYGDL